MKVTIIVALVVLVLWQAGRLNQPAAAVERQTDNCRAEVQYACDKWGGKVCGYLLGGRYR